MPEMIVRTDVSHVTEPDCDRTEVTADPPTGKPGASTVLEHMSTECHENDTDQMMKTNTTDLGTLTTGPVQPILTRYPRTNFGKNSRSFSTLGLLGINSWNTVCQKMQCSAILVEYFTAVQATAILFLLVNVSTGKI